MLRSLTTLVLCLAFALSLAAALPHQAHANEYSDVHWCRDHDGHRNWVVTPDCGQASYQARATRAKPAVARDTTPSYYGSGAGGTSIHEVVSATWPASLAPTAEYIAQREGGGIWNDGYCSFGIIPSTQVAYGINASAMSPYECSAAAYRIYQDVGWSAWSTYPG